MYGQLAMQEWPDTDFDGSSSAHTLSVLLVQDYCFKHQTCIISTSQLPNVHREPALAFLGMAHWVHPSPIV